MSWVSVSHRRLPNLGDQLCRPGLYFTLPIVESYDWLGKIPADADCLVGGGGLVDRWMTKLKRPRRRLIVWGTGWVYRKFDLLKRPKGIELYGSRDWGQADADAWVPCASCMHEAFDRDYAIKREVGGFWNSDFPRPKVEVPYMVNTEDEARIFAWLGSSETVVTNSYHGAYWATLFGCKVIIVNAYSGKFTHFHPSMQPPVVEANDWRTAKPVSPEGALALCRIASLKFYEKVLACAS